MGKFLDIGPRPIGTGNARGNTGIRVGLCKPHNGIPEHVDMVVPLQDVPGAGAHKIRVDKYGNIIYDELE